MREISYNRAQAVAYARKWALDRNPAYYDFEKNGGDCTNFVSQCIYNAVKVMNFTPITGWYYRSSHDRTASWSSVEYLAKFLLNNKSVGPYAHIVPLERAEPGDIIQLGTADGDFYHTPIITAVKPIVLVAAHSYDALDRPLFSYNYETIRVLHIEGVRMW